MFDYFYGNEPKQYAFYSIPQVLFTDEKFKKLSCEAKVLYGLLLDKAGLSVKNGWTDEDGKVYVYFKREDVCEMLGCKRDKASKILAELDEDTGIGLIKRVAQGQGKPARIYVRHFLRTIDENDNEIDKNAGNPANKEKSEDDSDNKTAFKKAEKSPSRGRKNRLQEDGKTALLPISHTKRTILSESSYHINQETAEQKPTSDPAQQDMIDTIDLTKKIKEIKERVSYDYLQKNYPLDMEEIDEIVDVIAWTELTLRTSLKIGKDNISTEIVRERLSKLDESHIEYVIDCISKQTVKINNRRNYLLTCLFNAPISISGYYSNLVRHDMYGE